MESSIKYQNVHSQINNHDRMFEFKKKISHIIIWLFSHLNLINYKLDKQNVVTTLISQLIAKYNFWLSIKFFIIGSVIGILNLQQYARGAEPTDWNCSLETSSSLLAYYYIRNNPEKHEKLKSYDNYKVFETNYLNAPASYLEYTSLIVGSTYGENIFSALSMIGGELKILGSRVAVLYFCLSMVGYLMLVLFPLNKQAMNFEHLQFMLEDKQIARQVSIESSFIIKQLFDWIKNSKKRQRDDILHRLKLRHEERKDITNKYKRLNLNLAIGNKERKTNAFNQANSEAYSKQKSGTLLKTWTISDYIELCSSIPTNSGKGRSFNLITEINQANELRGEIDDPLRIKQQAYLRQYQTDNSTYEMQVSLKNLRWFKPYVRDVNYYRMCVNWYPGTVLFNIMYFAISICYLSLQYSHEIVNQYYRACANQTNIPLEDYYKHNWHDTFLFFETMYSIFVFASAIAFFMTYFIGTVKDLIVWLKEFDQQLHIASLIVSKHHQFPALVNEFNINKEQLIEAVYNYHQIYDSTTKNYIKSFANEFGGLTSIWKRMYIDLFVKYKFRAQIMECIAVELLDKRQTIIRAAFLNFHLLKTFYTKARDEMTIILNGISFICIVCAFTTFIARSQFNSNINNLLYLMYGVLGSLDATLYFTTYVTSQADRVRYRLGILLRELKVLNKDPDLFDFYSRLDATFVNENFGFLVFSFKIDYKLVLSLNATIISIMYANISFN